MLHQTLQRFYAFASRLKAYGSFFEQIIGKISHSDLVEVEVSSATLVGNQAGLPLTPEDCRRESSYRRANQSGG